MAPAPVYVLIASQKGFEELNWLSGWLIWIHLCLCPCRWERLFVYLEKSCIRRTLLMAMLQQLLFLSLRTHGFFTIMECRMARIIKTHLVCVCNHVSPPWWGQSGEEARKSHMAVSASELCLRKDMTQKGKAIVKWNNAHLCKQVLTEVLFGSMS